MQTMVVSGGAGFIGSHLCKSLLSDGYNVICVDSLITGRRENLRELESDPKFKFLKQDVTILPIQNSIRQLAGKIHCIFHLASPASPNKNSADSYINHPIETLLANSVGTYNLLQLAKEFSAKFFYSSSSEVYGDPIVSPQNEQYFGNVNPIGVRSVYDEGKRFGEAIVMAYVRKRNLDARIARIFNTYGSKMRVDDGRVVSNFINQAISGNKITVYGKGIQTRSFCYIDDMIKGIKSAVFSDKAMGEVINLGNPNECTILELARLIKAMTNSSSEIVFEPLPEDDPKVRKPDIQKAKKLLKWEPTVRLEDGLKKTIEYFKRGS